jgi:hypothetical protein
MERKIEDDSAQSTKGSMRIGSHQPSHEKGKCTAHAQWDSEYLKSTNMFQRLAPRCFYSGPSKREADGQVILWLDPKGVSTQKLPPKRKNGETSKGKEAGDGKPGCTKPTGSFLVPRRPFEEQCMGEPAVKRQEEERYEEK